MGFFFSTISQHIIMYRVQQVYSGGGFGLKVFSCCTLCLPACFQWVTAALSFPLTSFQGIKLKDANQCVSRGKKRMHG